MAVKFRKNPAPLRGALFVSNPRKRKSTKKKRKTTRRRKNRLAIRKNRLALKRRNGTKKGMRRKTARKAYRKNRLAIRKNGTRKGMRRKTARKAYRKNPKMLKQLSYVLSPFNSKSFGGMEFGFMTKLAKQVSDIAPFGLPIGKFGSSVIHMSSPVLFGMGSGLVMTTGAELFSRIPYIGGIFQGKFGIAATGMGLAILSQLLPLKVETKKSLAIACTVGAGAINGYQLVQEAGGIRDAVMSLYPNMSGLHMGSLGKLGSVHMGDGMAYDVQPLSGLAFSGVHLQGTDTMYADAKLADSYLCPSDLSLDEGRSGIAGKKAYSNRFGQSPKRATQKAGSYSRHAGKEGHRWGWMIKLIGFDRFQKLCKMSPQKRQSVIKKMKSAAMEHARAEFDQQVALESTASPISGLNMDLSGLSIDPMGGLAAVGAGI
jgi:hypothetical protein